MELLMALHQYLMMVELILFIVLKTLYRVLGLGVLQL